MAANPIAQSQLYMRRVRRLLRGYGAVSRRSDDGELEDERSDRFYAKGRKQIEHLAGEIEAHTGCTFAGRRALDFGCGRGRMSMPLAGRCAHVVGVDVSDGALREAGERARNEGVRNVEWLGVDALGGLSGSYDLVVSFFVFQHIPAREGERLFATILAGLRPGGVGAVHFTLKPGRPAIAPAGEGSSARGTATLAQRLSPRYVYLRMNSYSLNRLGALFADAGIEDWHVNWHASKASRGEPYPAATLIFRKP